MRKKKTQIKPECIVDLAMNKKTRFEGFSHDALFQDYISLRFQLLSRTNDVLWNCDDTKRSSVSKLSSIS